MRWFGQLVWMPLGHIGSPLPHQQTVPLCFISPTTANTALSTHRWSPLGRYRCTLPLCGHIPLRLGRGWSNTGWSPSHSNHPWNPLDSDSEGPRSGGWAGTTWKVRRWMEQSCWSAALRCTSCSSDMAPANTHCHRMGEPVVMAERRFNSLGRFSLAPVTQAYIVEDPFILYDVTLFVA